MKTALLVVDVQQYYLPDIPEDLPQKIANHFQSVSYDLIAFTVFQNVAGSNFVRSLKWEKCSDSTDTKSPYPLAVLANNENTFKRAAYSAFKTTGLDQYLTENTVERLTICGVDSDACVLATAFEAFDLGYHVKVDFDLSYSSGGLQSEAYEIVARSITSRD